MTDSTQKNNFFKESLKKVPSLSLFFFLAIATLLSVGGLGIWTVEKQMKENFSAQLELILAGNLESLRLWTNDTKRDAQVLARQPEINRKLTSLIEIAQPDSVTAEQLRQTEELTWLRKNLGDACETYGFIGFVVFDLTGLQVGALLEEPVGKRQLLGKSDFFYRSLQGDTVVSQPFAGEVDLPDEAGVFHSGRPTMFVSTPIHDESGDTVGILAFRLRPGKDFSHILSVSQFGNTGETYAFNDEGLLVSNSRFDRQLISLGLLQPEHSSIFNIQIRDPGRNLTIAKLRPEDNISQWPLTFMVNHAIQNESGIQVEGYNDYRGVPVVGAWTWIPELDIGLATEVNVAEAFRPLKTLMTWFLFLFGLVLFIGGLALILRSRYSQSQQKTIENENRLSAFLESASDPIISIDTFGTIQSMNSAVEKQFGYQHEELLGENVNILMPNPYRREHDQYLQTYLKTGKQNVINMLVEVPAKRKNGTSFPVELSVSESVVNGKKSFLGIIRDISERKESEKELQHAYAKLEERIKERTEELWHSKNQAEKTNRAKSEFLSRMSHELRTPMNAILGFTQLMHESTKDPLPKVHQKRTTQILEAGNHLLELINEVLDLATIEAGKITVSLEPVCINDLVEEVLTVIRPLAQNFQVNLIDQVTSHDRNYVLADKTRLKQVLLNLVSNGIKYNRKEGSVTLSVQLEEGSNLRINITDTGMGIPEEKLTQLFDPFNRLGAEGGEIEGTGIGMTISKKLIEVMNGSIGVTSALGEGSTFYVSLPVCFLTLGKIESRNTPMDNAIAGRKETRRFTILYIEDNPANLKLIEDILTDYPEVRLLSATYAQMGIDIALSHKPDLILMDINLPDIDGIEALKRLRNFEETHETPVIAMSANAMKKDIDRAMAEGFKTYITKPIDIKNFRRTIEKELKSATIH